MDAKRLRKAEAAGDILSSLAHPTRLLIICLLLEKERYVLELLEQLGTTKGNISQHLRVLENQGHIAGRKEANRVYYRVADPKLKRLVATVQSLYCPGLAPRRQA